MSAFDAVDGASSAASKCYRLVRSKQKLFKEVRPGNETAFEVLKELARTRRRNADKVDPGIGKICSVISASGTKRTFRG